jgi:hypothetical protein
MLDRLLNDLDDAGVRDWRLGLEGVVATTVLDGVEEGVGGVSHLCWLGREEAVGGRGEGARNHESDG